MMKVDFHVHSVSSDDGLSTVEQLAAAAKKRGLDAICICDHNRFTLTQTQCIDGVTVFPGCECSTDHGHILALFCRAPFEWERKPLPRVADIIQKIHENGGIAVLAHPYEKANAEPAAISPLPDGVEVCNSRAYFHNPAANDMALQFARQHGLVEFGGSDAHSAAAVGNCYTEVTAEKPEEIEGAVRRGACSGVWLQNTPRVQKGLSQFKKARNSRRPLRILKGVCYLFYCLLRDLFRI